MNNKHRVFFSLILLPLLLAMTSIFGQQNKPLTLGEAVELSIKNSKQLQLSKARVAEAVAVAKQATQARLPDASIGVNFLQLSNATVHSYNKDSAAAAPLNINQTIYGSANISYPIFTGFKIKFGIESAKYLEKASLLDADNDKEAVILNTISAYVNLYKASIAAQLVNQNLVESRKRDTDFSNLERNGLLARNDLLKAQLQTSQFELGLLDAENDIQLAQVNMNLMLGLPEATQLILDSSSFKQPAEVKTIEEYEQIAVQNRYDMKALDNRKKAAEAGVKSAKADYYPSVALTGGYLAADLPKFMSITNALNVGVGVKYSLSSLWKTNAKVEQAKAKEQQLLATEAMLLDDIHFSINKAYADYYSGLKKIDVLKKEVEQSTENYRISKNKYDNSLLTLTDLLDADVAQLRARLNLVLARADVYVSYQTLLQKAGLVNQ
ncbi:MAG TPA: TolC family protein [Panacibacter sp.]|nr:TolC family protein [Panacibacter sp.]HNP45288.1 TolC family protein [Panacibacter sp.]